ncbi:glutamate receptor ionotropic, NMDA 2D-like [Amblyomma americanum]
MVQKGGIDIMLGPMAPTTSRAEAADFTAPYDVNYVSLMTWKPVKYVDPFNFVLSFDPNVWLGIFFSWLLLAFVTAKLDNISGRLLRQKRRSFAEFIWIYFKLLFPNSYPNNTASWFRLLLGVWLLAMVVVMGLLNCTLTSTMLVRKTTDYVDSFDDLLRFPKVKIATEKSTYFSRILKDPVGETFTKLSSRHEPVFSIYRAGPVLDTVMDQVLKQKRVMIGTDVMLKSHIADYFVKTGTCRHHVTSGVGGVMHIVMLLRKTLPKDFKRKLDRFISHINECDVYHKEMEWRLRNYTMCKNERDDGIKPLAMVDLQGGFIVLVVGVGVSLVVFLAEWIYTWRTRTRARPQPRIQVKGP